MKIYSIFVCEFFFPPRYPPQVRQETKLCTTYVVWCVCVTCLIPITFVTPGYYHRHLPRFLNVILDFQHEGNTAVNCMTQGRIEMKAMTLIIFMSDTILWLH